MEKYYVIFVLKIYKLTLLFQLLSFNYEFKGREKKEAKRRTKEKMYKKLKEFLDRNCSFKFE